MKQLPEELKGSLTELEFIQAYVMAIGAKLGVTLADLVREATLIIKDKADKS